MQPAKLRAASPLADHSESWKICDGGTQNTHQCAACHPVHRRMKSSTCPVTRRILLGTCLCTGMFSLTQPSAAAGSAELQPHSPAQLVPLGQCLRKWKQNRFQFCSGLGNTGTLHPEAVGAEPLLGGPTQGFTEFTMVLNG